MIEDKRKKVTVSLSEVDASLIDEIADLTGAYTASEVVRDALRLTYRIKTEEASHKP